MAASVRFSDLGIACDAAEGGLRHALRPGMKAALLCGEMRNSARGMADRPWFLEVECGRHV